MKGGTVKTEVNNGEKPSRADSHALFVFRWNLLTKYRAIEPARADLGVWDA
jgi:hypothetical protein